MSRVFGGNNVLQRSNPTFIVVVFSQPLRQHRIPLRHGHVVDGICDSLLCPDKDQYPLRTGYPGIDEVPLQHHVVAHQDRHDHDGVFTPLTLMNRCGVSEDNLVQFRNVIDDLPSIKGCRQFPLLQIDLYNRSDIPVEDFFVIVVSDLHDLVPDTVGVTTPMQAGITG